MAINSPIPDPDEGVVPTDLWAGAAVQTLRASWWDILSQTSRYEVGGVGAGNHKRLLTTALSVNGQRLSELSKHQRGIDAAEGEVVAHGVFHLSGAGLADDVIQWRAVRVKIFEIQGRVQPAFADHLNRGPGLDSATGTQCMPQVPFDTTKGHPLAKKRGGGVTFGHIAGHGRGAVAVNVTNSLGRQAGICQSQLHGNAHAGAIGQRDVGTVAVGAVTHDFSKYRRAPGRRMLQLFQNKRRGAFANH